MALYIDGRRTAGKFAKAITVSALLSRLGLGRERALVRRNGRLITEFDEVSPQDRVEVFTVGSQG
ncbi:MAG: MoaD/ThiS family protein [Candidatus Micrarchaeia archaeon]